MSHFDNSFVSNLHIIGAVILVLIGLQENKYELESFETTVLCWATGYFILDCFDCIARKDVMFFAHAIVGFSLIKTCTQSPFYERKAASLGYGVELSTFFFNHWKTSKKKVHFGTFLVSFFVVRLLYTPFFVWKMNEVDNGGFWDGHVMGNRFAFFASLAFYVMNCAWFVKGVQMYLRYDEKKQKKKK